MKSLRSWKTLWVLTTGVMIWLSSAAFAQQQAPPAEPPPLPEGEGKAVVEKVCATMCHDYTNITRTKRTAKEWEETIAWMQMEGAAPTEEEYKVILAYVTKHFLKE